MLVSTSSAAFVEVGLRSIIRLMGSSERNEQNKGYRPLGILWESVRPIARVLAGSRGRRSTMWEEDEGHGG